MPPTDTSEIKRQTAELFVKYLKCKHERMAQFPVPQPSRRERYFRDKIYCLNWGLAVRVTERELKKCNVPREDLLQEAGIGLKKAVERYDPSKGTAFSSLAIPWIQGEILHYLRAHRFTHKANRTGQETAAAIRKGARDMTAAGRPITEEQLAIEGYRMTAEQWQALDAETRSQNCRSLNESDIEIPSDCNPVQLLEMQEREASLRSLVAIAMSSLSEQQQECLQCVFWGGWQIEDVAKRLGVSPSQAETIYQTALQRLREFDGSSDPTPAVIDTREVAAVGA